jgi:outer membrane protein TolC
MNRWALFFLALFAPLVAAQTQQRFLQLLVARSVEVRYSQLSAEASRRLFQGELGLYESVFSLSIRDEFRRRQRTADERVQNFVTGNTRVLDEIARTNEVGLRNKLPSGGELTLSYKVAKKSNNLIPQSSSFDSEYNTLLNLTLKQPLLRNAGQSVTETDLRVAELEHHVSNQQFKLQTAKTAIEGLTLFWQLHRAEVALALRRRALSSSEALLADSRARIEAGKLPASALLEAQGTLMSRQAEVLRSDHALREAQGKVATALNLTWIADAEFSTHPTFKSVAAPSKAASRLDGQALEEWPPYQIAQLKLLQAQSRLAFARNQMRPALDLFFGYSGTGYDNLSAASQNTARQGRFPEWNLGLSLDLPMRGNQKAEQQFLAQSARVTQAELEILAVRNSFANDLVVRQSDLAQAVAVFESSKEEMILRQSLLEKEQERYQIGVGLLGSLIQKQLELTESQLRLLDNQIRYEIALATWRYMQGALLSDHQIQITEQTTSKQ